jgi:hypothetical protein
MSFQTWAGLRDDPAHLDGYGPLPAHVARMITAQMAVTGTWRCAVLDDVHGTLVGLGRRVHLPEVQGYTPGARLAEYVRAAEPTCTFPGGCGTRAVLCDLDHTRPYPAGRTCSCNLQPLCRRHHRLKTTGHYTVTPADPAPGDTENSNNSDHTGRRGTSQTAASHAGGGPAGQVPPGSLRWTTRAGRTYLRPPTDLRPPPRPPGSRPVPHDIHTDTAEPDHDHAWLDGVRDDAVRVPSEPGVVGRTGGGAKRSSDPDCTTDDEPPPF